MLGDLWVHLRALLCVPIQLMSYEMYLKNAADVELFTNSIKHNEKINIILSFLLDNVMYGTRSPTICSIRKNHR